MQNMNYYYDFSGQKYNHPLSLSMNSFDRKVFSRQTSLEISFVLRGSYEVVTEHISHVLREQELVVISPNEIHILKKIDPDSVILILHIDFDRIPDTLLGSCRNIFYTTICNLQNNRQLLFLLKEELRKLIVVLLQGNVNEGTDLFELNEIMMKILCITKKELSHSFEQLPVASIHHDNYIKAIRYIDQHYHENIHLSDIAKTLSFSNSYTSRLFTKFTLYDKSQFNRPEWKALKAPERRQAVRDYLVGKRCFGGLDLSTTTDLTAFTLLFPPQEGLDTWVVLFWAWRPEEGVLEAEQRDHVPYRDWTRAGFLELCPGDMVDFTMVEDAVAAAVDVFDLDTLGVDPYLSRTLTPRLMERGVNVVEIPQDMKNLSPAMKEVERLTRAHQMLHEHNTAARWCFGNVRCAVDGNENIKPMKNRSIGRIDITVAWIIAVAVALLRMPVGPDINEHILSEDWGI